MNLGAVCHDNSFMQYFKAEKDCRNGENHFDNRNFMNVKVEYYPFTKTT